MCFNPTHTVQARISNTLEITFVQKQFFRQTAVSGHSHFLVLKHLAREEKELQTTVNKRRLLCLLPERMEKSGWVCGNHLEYLYVTADLPAIFSPVFSAHT